MLQRYSYQDTSFIPAQSQPSVAVMPGGRGEGVPERSLSAPELLSGSINLAGEGLCLVLQLTQQLLVSGSLLGS